jgi:hypothetical protein
MVQLLICFHTLLGPAPVQQEHTALGLLGWSCCSLVPLPVARAPVVLHCIKPNMVCIWLPLQEGGCGPGWPLPDKLQFLDKNSTFRTGGRRLEGFRLLARAVLTQEACADVSSADSSAGREVVLAQGASAPFKVRGLPSACNNSCITTGWAGGAASGGGCTAGAMQLWSWSCGK